MILPRFRKAARFARRFSIGHGTARPDIQLLPQIVQGLVAFLAARRSFIRRFIARQLAAARRQPSAVVPAAPKSP